MRYQQVFISAENKSQAQSILDALLKERVVVGGPILEGPATFWWKGEIVSMEYAYVMTYTTLDRIERVTEIAEAASVEEVPMISFIPFTPNSKLAKLIDDTL